MIITGGCVKRGVAKVVYLYHCSPAHELVFSGKKDSDALCTLTLKNLSDYTVAYKVSY